MKQNLFLIFSLVLLIAAVLGGWYMWNEASLRTNYFGNNLLANGSWLHQQNQNVAQMYKYERFTGQFMGYNYDQDTKRYTLTIRSTVDDSLRKVLLPSKVDFDRIVKVTIGADDGVPVDIPERFVTSLFTQGFVPGDIVILDLIGTDLGSNNYDIVKNVYFWKQTT